MTMEIKGGKDYVCTASFKMGNCSYTKGKVYHSLCDGHLNDDNGTSWPCSDEFANGYLKPYRPERTAKDIVEDISNILGEVRKYLEDTPNCLFYWISNKEVQDFVKDNPEDYDYMFNINVISLRGISCEVEIEIEETKITRFCILPNFRRDVELRFAEWNGKVKELQIAEAEKGIEYHAKEIEKLKNEIAELKK